MGLSGRKQKQKIPNDPRNLSWADDASRFGSSYLSKFGWDASKGLGATGEGMTSHIKVSQKLDMMGIGAAHQKDPNGIAWKQNRDFENLLRRLNASSGSVEALGAVDVEMKEGFAAETAVQDDEDKDDKERKREKKEKKEKRRKEKEAEKEKKKTDKKRKHDGDQEDRSEKKRRKASEEPSPEKQDVSPPPIAAPAKQPAPPRYRAHRARAIAAKSISHKSSVHISEILGIAPSASTSESTSAVASGLSTPAEQGKLTVISELEKLTTSTKSVADYFKEKLLLKGSKPTSVATTPPDSSESPTPLVSSSTSQRSSDYEEDRPAGGLGFGARGLGMGGGGLGFSNLRMEVQEECNVVEESTMRMGLSKFSSLMSSKLLASESMSFDKGSQTPEISGSKVEEVVDGGESSSSEEEESREERKRRRKAEKEKKKADAGRKDKKSKDKREKKEKKEKKSKEREASDEDKSKEKGEKDKKKERKSKKTRDA